MTTTRDKTTDRTASEQTNNKTSRLVGAVECECGAGEPSNTQEGLAALHTQQQPDKEGNVNSVGRLKEAQV